MYSCKVLSVTIQLNVKKKQKQTTTMFNNCFTDDKSDENDTIHSQEELNKNVVHKAFEQLGPVC